MGDYKDGQVVETYNSMLKKMLHFLGSMNEPRQSGMLSVTAAAFNTDYREQVRQQMEDGFGAENLGIDVWRRFCNLKTLNIASTCTPSEASILDVVTAPRQVQPTVVTAPRQVPAALQAPSQAVAHAAAATSATAAAAVPAASTLTNSEASRLLDGVSHTPASDTASNPNFVQLSDISDSESDTDVSNQRRQRSIVNDAKIAAMMEGRLLELERNRRRDEERDELQKRYDEFVRDAEQRNGGEQHCDGHLKVFCGYMRLSSEDAEKARYRSQVDLGHLLAGRVCMHVIPASHLIPFVRVVSSFNSSIRTCSRSAHAHTDQ